jgi:hypothetical protein
VLEGPGTRYTPEIMEMLRGKSHAAGETAKERGMRSYQEEALKRGGAGMFRSPYLSGGIRDIIMESEAEESKRNFEFEVKKINADFEDKMSALEAAQKWLDSARDAEIRRELGDIEIRRITETSRLGYAQIANAKYIADLQYKASIAQTTMQGALAGL